MNKEEVKVILKEFNSKKAWGISSAVDIYDCNPDIIRDAEKIKEYVKQLIELIDMKAYGETIVIHFGEDERVAGYSMTQLIETSLISGHFANESNAAYIDIFSCKSYDPLVAEKFTLEFFQGKKSNLQVNVRY